MGGILPVMSEANVEAIRRGTEALNRLDADALASLLTEDAEIVPLRAAMEGTVDRGPRAAAEFLEDVRESWEDLRLEETEIRDLGEHVLAFGVMRARGRLSGAGFETQIAWVVRFRDGLIKSMRTFTDLDAAREEAGVQE
jgi:ketosteroid isomerase-like protein